MDPRGTMSLITKIVTIATIGSLMYRCIQQLKYIFDEKNFIYHVQLVVTFDLSFVTTRVLIKNVAYD